MITLITSGSFVNSEMKAEFGLLVPAFLPLGTRRLIDHQLSALRVRGGAGEIYLSLPQSFQVDDSEKAWLSANGVTTIFVPDGLELGESILHCIEARSLSGPFSILHGDTLLQPPEGDETNVHFVGERVGGYAWGCAITEGGRFIQAAPLSQGEEESGPVLVGYFSFSCAQDFAQALREENGDFLAALGAHAQVQDVQARFCHNWFDFGHLQTYYRSRAAFASSRAFNDLEISGGLVRKWSEDRRKIQAEANWFSKVPAHLHPYTARLVDAGDSARGWQYVTEYEHLPTLQELFIFGRLDYVTWDEILEACCECLEAFAATEVADAPRETLSLLSNGKTFARIEQYEAESGVDFSRDMELNGKILPAPKRIAEEMAAVVEAAVKRNPTMMHGDFCFSNILYNSRTRRVRLIDPRGQVDNSGFTNGGDVRYDMAKLAHSVVGLYDLIIAGRFRCEQSMGPRLQFELEFQDTPTHRWVGQRFEQLSIAGTGFSAEEVRALTVLLFLSMLPLHADHPTRQVAFLANALRLYREFA